MSKAKPKLESIFFKDRNQKLRDIQTSFSISSLSLGPYVPGMHLIYKNQNEKSYKIGKIEKTLDSEIVLKQIWNLSSNKQEQERKIGFQDLKLELQTYLFCGIGYKIIRDQIKPIILLDRISVNGGDAQLEMQEEKQSTELLKKYFQKQEYYFKQTQNLQEDLNSKFSRLNIYGYQFSSNTVARIPTTSLIQNVHCINLPERTNFEQTNLFNLIQSSNNQQIPSSVLRKLIDINRSLYMTKSQLSSYQLKQANIQQSMYHQIEVVFNQQRLIPHLNLSITSSFTSAVKTKKGSLIKDRISQPVKRNQNSEEITKKGILLNFLPNFKQIMIRLYESNESHWLPLQLCGDKIDIRVNFYKGFATNKSIQLLDVSHPLNQADLVFTKNQQILDQIQEQDQVQMLTAPFNSQDSIGKECFKCRDVLTDVDERLQCSNCKKSFHISCLTYLSEQIQSSLRNIITWHCPACMPCINCKTRASAATNCTFLICNKCNKGTHYQCLCPSIKALIPAPIANKYNQDETQPNFKLQLNNNQLKFKVNALQTFDMYQDEQEDESKDQYPDGVNKEDQGFDIEIPNNIILEHSFSQSRIIFVWMCQSCVNCSNCKSNGVECSILASKSSLIMNKQIQDLEKFLVHNHQASVCLSRTQNQSTDGHHDLQLGDIIDRSPSFLPISAEFCWSKGFEFCHKCKIKRENKQYCPICLKIWKNKSDDQLQKAQKERKGRKGRKKKVQQPIPPSQQNIEDDKNQAQLQQKTKQELQDDNQQQQTLQEDEPMIECNCGFWVHISCDITLTEQTLYKYQEEEKAYLCPFCNQRTRILNQVDFVKQLIKYDLKGFFYAPVDTTRVPNYTKVIKQPMCFQVVLQNCQNGLYIGNPEDLQRDFELICKNAITFNMPKEEIYDEAMRILLLGRKFFQKYSDTLYLWKQNQIEMEQFITKKRKGEKVEMPEKHPSVRLSQQHKKSKKDQTTNKNNQKN